MQTTYKMKRFFFLESNKDGNVTQMIQDEPGEAYLFCVALLITSRVHTTYDNIFFSFLITALGFRLIQLKDLLFNCDFVLVQKTRKHDVSMQIYKCSTFIRH